MVLAVENPVEKSPKVMRESERVGRERKSKNIIG